MALVLDLASFAVTTSSTAKKTRRAATQHFAFYSGVFNSRLRTKSMLCASSLRIWQAYVTTWTPSTAAGAMRFFQPLERSIFIEAFSPVLCISSGGISETTNGVTDNWLFRPKVCFCKTLSLFMLSLSQPSDDRRRQFAPSRTSHPRVRRELCAVLLRASASVSHPAALQR